MKSRIVGRNKAGKRVAIFPRGAGFLVMIEKINYQYGRDVKHWACCEAFRGQGHFEFQKMAAEGLDWDAAVELYNKKVINDHRYDLWEDV